MVRKQTNESEMQEENDKKSGSNKFFYQNAKQKANPWSSFEEDGNDASTKTDFKQPLQSSSINRTKASDLGVVSSKSKFDLDSVWSVRKNVPLSNSKQTSQANLQTGNSFYSRHAGGIIGSQKGKRDQKVTNSESGYSSWHMKKPGYSYTNQGSLKRQANDDDDEFDFNESKKGNFQRDQSPSQRFGGTTQRIEATTSKGNISNLINPHQRGSARTQRAQKMHEAYLKSAGLGFYTPNDPFHGKKEDALE